MLGNIQIQHCGKNVKCVNIKVIRKYLKNREVILDEYYFSHLLY